MRLLLLSLFVEAAIAWPAIAQNAVVADVVTGFVRPAYAELHSVSSQLRSQMEALCAEPSPDKLSAAQSSFVAFVGAWSEIEIVRFGPIAQQNRLERILFWPDRKSIGLKQVQAAIVSKDATAADPVTLKDKSVAMQGLGALEFVLFGAGSDELTKVGEPYRCSYGLAVAKNIKTIAADVSDAWQDPAGFSKDWSNPASDNRLYRTDAEAMNELLGVFVNGLEMIRDVRIDGFLGKNPDSDKPKQAVFWRSHAAVISLAGNVRGMQRLFDAANFSHVLPADSAWLLQSADAQFMNAKRALEIASGPVDKVLADPEKREALEYARLITSTLSELFGTRISGALGLTAGFSSLDGD